MLQLATASDLHYIHRLTVAWAHGSNTSLRAGLLQANPAMGVSVTSDGVRHGAMIGYDVRPFETAFVALARDLGSSMVRTFWTDAVDFMSDIARTRQLRTLLFEISSEDLRWVRSVSRYCDSWGRLEDHWAPGVHNLLFAMPATRLETIVARVLGDL